MIDVDSSVLGPALAKALAQKGYTTLTTVQAAVLDPALAGRDLRITSQTGSGKTVAIGFAMRDIVAGEGEPAGGKEAQKSAAKGLARPKALVVAPTRELARQVEAELSWLYAPLGARVVSVTGGASYTDERRALAGGPAVVVGTPGRLLDHLQRGSIDGGAVGAVVLDEADRLLDLGFRDDLEAILAFAPEGHRTHLVSATFPREVRALADATQEDPVHVEGTRLGAANVDIEHVVHLVDSRQRMDAIVNILLANPDEQTLVFARTRSDVAAITRELCSCGFGATSLSGDMDQNARHRALGSFKSGDLRVLVATDVAARGIDVQEIARVIQAEPPTDADAYTHRSGRTGRAGRKGTSAVIATPAELPRTTYLLQRAGIQFRLEPVPSANEIREAADARAFAAITAEEPEDSPGFDERTWSLAKQVAEAGEVTLSIARLLRRTAWAGPTDARDVRVIEPPRRGARERPGAERERPGAERERPGAERGAPTPRPRRGLAGTWVPFRVSWGEEQGADTRRLLAMACRRGRVQNTAVGTIRVARRHSVIDIASSVADAFAAAAGEPDPRDPRVTFSPDNAPAARPNHAAAARPSDDRPSRPAAARDDRPSRPAAARDDRPSRPAAARDDRPSRPAAARDDRPSRPAAARPARPAHARDDRPARPAHAPAKAAHARDVRPARSAPDDRRVKPAAIPQAPPSRPRPRPRVADAPPKRRPR